MEQILDDRTDEEGGPADLRYGIRGGPATFFGFHLRKAVPLPEPISPLNCAKYPKQHPASLRFKFPVTPEGLRKVESLGGARQ